MHREHESGADALGRDALGGFALGGSALGGFAARWASSVSAGELGSSASHSPDVRQLDPELLGDHVARLYRAAYGLCGSRQDAEDLVQDTYERVLRRPRFLRRDQDAAYLLRVLRNTWISSGRSRRAVTVPLDGENAELRAPGADPVAGQVIDGGALFGALGDLSVPLREAVVAVDVVGLSYREAARALGTKEGTIMSRLHRGRAQIASALDVDA
ncbi:MAG TPA: RNA polymerase sigma factor [Solirubrobacteraceae bacterium]|nr:RNA polymerase sigma factor [Solirubrobacteraceae bacterium]